MTRQDMRHQTWCSAYREAWWLMVPKLLVTIVGSFLFVYAIYVWELITTAADGSSKFRWTYTCITAALKAAAVLIKLLGHSYYSQFDCVRRVLSVLKFVVYFASTATASWSFGKTSSASMQSINTLAVILIVPGAVMLAVNAVGWFGKLHKVRWMMIASGVLMFVVALGCAILVICAFAIPTKQVFGPSLRSSMVEYNSTRGVKQTWDFLQKNMNCCGVDRAQDWISSHYSEIPSSCMDNHGIPYAQGCVASINAWRVDNFAAIIGTCASIIFIQILGGIVSTMYGLQEMRKY